MCCGMESRRAEYERIRGRRFMISGGGAAREKKTGWLSGRCIFGSDGPRANALVAVIAGRWLPTGMMDKRNVRVLREGAHVPGANKDGRPGLFFRRPNGERFSWTERKIGRIHCSWEMAGEASARCLGSGKEVRQVRQATERINVELCRVGWMAQEHGTWESAIPHWGLFGRISISGLKRGGTATFRRA